MSLKEENEQLRELLRECLDCLESCYYNKDGNLCINARAKEAKEKAEEFLKGEIK